MKKVLLLLLFFSSFVFSQVTNGLIQEFNFDNSLSSVSETATFTNTTSNYALDRYFNPSSALVCNATATPSAIINNLPIGSAARTIAMWINPSTVTNDNVLFTYGNSMSGAGDAAYGGSFNTANFFQFTYASNIAAPSPTVANGWKHIIMSLDANGVAKIYINGALLTTSTLSVNTATTSTFYLGSLFSTGTPFAGLIDDLKIYNRAVTDSEAKEIYNGPSQAPRLVAEYNFNQTILDVNGNAPFIDYGLNTYGTDRNGNANQCYHISNRGADASIRNLPLSNTARSVSIWVKTTVFQQDNVLFSYGNNSANGTYGFSFDTNTLNNFGWDGYDLAGAGVIPDGVWKHVVTTYSPTGEIVVYIDGTPTLTGSVTTWNTLPTTFNIGKTVVSGTSFWGMVDDLKIYNYALSQAEVSALYTNNTLTTQDFNQNNLEVSLYPNPANDVLNIETTLEIQTVEIYNIQGQKVKSANQKQINVSDLASGMYMVRIQDADNGIATKKFVKQ